MITATLRRTSDPETPPPPWHVPAAGRALRRRLIRLIFFLGLCNVILADLAMAQISPPNPPVQAQSVPPEVRISKYVSYFNARNHWRLDWPSYNQFIEIYEPITDFISWRRDFGGTENYSDDLQVSQSWGPPNRCVNKFIATWVPLPSLGTKTEHYELWEFGVLVHHQATTQNDISTPTFPMEYVSTVGITPPPWWLIANPEGGDLTLYQDNTIKTAQTTVEFFSGGFPSSTTNRMWVLQFQGWDQSANGAVMDAAYLTNFAGVTIGGVPVDANGVAYFRMADYRTTNVTPLLPAAFSNYTYAIAPTELTSSIAFDANNDGQINLYGTNDLTTSAAPFVFWVNNDRDVWSNNDQDFIDVTPATGNDYAQDWIHNARDLEDYNRLAIRIPAVVCRDTNWQCRISYGGKIKLFTYPYDDNRHVQDQDFAQNTLVNNWYTTNYPFSTGWGYYVGESVSASPLNLPRNLLETCGQLERPNGPNGPEYARFNFLFKGGSTGKHRLKLELYYAGNLVSRTGAWLNLMDMENMYDHYTAGDTSSPVFPISPTPTLVRANQQTGLTDDYVLYVHGWRMETWERRKFAETAYKRLWWNGYRGHFGLFSWPTEYVDTELVGGPLLLIDNRNFDRSEWRAWKSGTPLAAYLTTLNSGTYQGRVRLFAHSMGNIVCAEALRLLTAQGATDAVHTYVSCQGALASHAYAYDPSSSVERVLTLENPKFSGGEFVGADDGTPNVYGNFPYPGDPPYLDGISGAAKFINYFNPDDYALAVVCVNQSLKPDYGLGGLYYHYDTTRDFWYGGYSAGAPAPLRILDRVADRYEIFSMAAEARCYATGAQPNVGGAFSGQLNLQADYGFGSASSHHSAQFNSSIQRRAGFWRQLLINDFDIH